MYRVCSVCKERKSWREYIGSNAIGVCLRCDPDYTPPMHTIVAHIVNPGAKRRCKACNQALPIGEFDKFGHGYYRVCRMCRSDSGTRNAGLTDKQWADSVRDIINLAKADGCSLCGERERVCLHLHHKDPSTKSFELASAISMRRVLPLDAVLAEAEKCVTLCSNCHAKVHAGILSIDSHDGIIWDQD